MNAEKGANAVSTPVSSSSGVEEVDFDIYGWKLRRVDEILGRYDVLKVIGKGVYGSVYRVLVAGMKETPYALKIMNVKPYEMPREIFGEEYSAKQREMIVLKMGFLSECVEMNIASRLLQMPHPNVCDIKDISFSIDSDKAIVRSVHLLMEEYPHSLENTIQMYGPPKFTERNRVEILHMIALGLAHLHGMGIIHRDIKPSNLMISRDLKVKIIDFGLSIDLTMTKPGISLSTDVYALPFRPPEIILGDSHYNWSADIWALGCVVYLLWFSEFIVPVVIDNRHDDELSQGFACVHMGMKLGVPTEESWPKHKTLPFWNKFGNKFSEIPHDICKLHAIPPLDHIFDRMIIYDPEKRMSAVEICKELTELKSADRS